jgi:hypothetical protein
MDMLGYTYNYQANFDGYDPNNDKDNTTNITKLRLKFENQKPHDVINNLFEQ